MGEKPSPHCGKLFHPISDFFAAPVLVYIFHIFGMLEGFFGIILDHQPSCHGGMALPVPGELNLLQSLSGRCESHCWVVFYHFGCPQGLALCLRGDLLPHVHHWTLMSCVAFPEFDMERGAAPSRRGPPLLCLVGRDVRWEP